MIISPSKEMTEQPQTSDRRPELIELTQQISSGTELTEDSSFYRAIELYNGLQFRYLRAGLTEEDLTFLDDSLRILSATYGVVKPLDGIRRYRQDFTAKGLYKAWDHHIYQQLTQESRLILNLASDEFSKTVTRYSQDHDQLVQVSFFEKDEEGLIKKHSTISKKGRGQLVNYIARNRITDFEAVRAFDDMGYRFNEEESTGLHWVFIRSRD